MNGACKPGNQTDTVQLGLIVSRIDGIGYNGHLMLGTDLSFSSFTTEGRSSIAT
jgi:hypothetical protein